MFRSPTLEYSSSSSDEDEVMSVKDKGSFLPSIGPPKILQYVKESVNPPFTNEFAEEDEAAGSSNVDHSCAFCKAEVLEKIDASQHVSLVETVSTRPCWTQLFTSSDLPMTQSVIWFTDQKKLFEIDCNRIL